jgi:hypothetical protein
MGEYVDIKSSPDEIISIANGLHARGEELKKAVEGINGDIKQHEGRQETFPPDKFTAEFRKHYDQAVPGADGKTVPAHEAIQQSALYCGEKLSEIGEFVNKAMTNYGVTDIQSGDDIGKTM